VLAEIIFVKKIKVLKSNTDNISMREFLNNVFGETQDTWAQAILFVGFVLGTIAMFIFALSPFAVVWG